MALYCKDQHAPLDPSDWETFYMHKTSNPWETSQLNWKIPIYFTFLYFTILSVMIGRCFLIIELMLRPSGLYCVVNITSFVLLFALFC